MDEQRKKAYRWLLYRAMLEIRPVRWIGDRWLQRFNPLCWWSFSRRVRVAGAIADWLHNLALYSALDFEQFDEDRFWEDHRWFVNNYPWADLDRYRTEFDQRASPAETKSV